MSLNNVHISDLLCQISHLTYSLTFEHFKPETLQNTQKVFVGPPTIILPMTGEFGDSEHDLIVPAAFAKCDLWTCEPRMHCSVVYIPSFGHALVTPTAWIQAGIQT